MKLVCLGDSLTYGFGVPLNDSWIELLKRNKNINIINKGQNGNTTTDMMFKFFEDVIENKPTHVFIMGGTNDFLMNYPVENVFKNMTIMIKEASEHNIIPIIGIQIFIEETMATNYWCSHINYKKANGKIKEYRKLLLNYCKSNDIQYFDFFKLYIEKQLNTEFNLYIDGVHPSIYGHKLIANFINLCQ